MYAMSTQRLSDHRSTAKVALAVVIFVSGLALGAVLGNNVATVAGQASVSAPALLGGNRLGETGRDTRIGFDNAHHVRQAAPQSLESNAVMNAIRYDRRAEIGVGGP